MLLLHPLRDVQCRFLLGEERGRSGSESGRAKIGLESLIEEDFLRSQCYRKVDNRLSYTHPLFTRPLRAAAPDSSGTSTALSGGWPLLPPATMTKAARSIKGGSVVVPGGSARPAEFVLTAQREAFALLGGAPAAAPSAVSPPAQRGLGRARVARLTLTPRSPPRSRPPAASHAPTPPTTHGPDQLAAASARSERYPS